MAKSKKQLQQEEEEKKRREQQERINNLVSNIRKNVSSASIGDENAPWRQDLTDDYRLRAVRNYNNQANYLGLPTYKENTLSRRASQAQANKAGYQAAGGPSYEKWLDDHFIGPKVDKNAKSTSILDLMNSYQSKERQAPQAQAKQEQPYVTMMKGAAAKASGQMAGDYSRRGMTDVMTGRTAGGSTAGRNAQAPGIVRTGAAGAMSGFVPDMEYLNRRTGNGPTPISSRKLPEPMVTGGGIGGAAGQNNGQIRMPQIIGANGQNIGTGTKAQAREFTAPRSGRITAPAGAGQTAKDPAAGVRLPEQFGGMAAAMPENKSRYGLGNIDLLNRPIYTQPDGSISTVNSMSYWDDREKKEILIPTIVNGKQVSDDEAIRHYEETGEHLGKFNNPQEADQYAEWLHGQQEDYYAGQEQKKQDIMLGKHAMLTAKNLGVTPYTGRTLEDSMRRDMNRATQAARQNDIERRMNLYNEYSDVFTLGDVRELATSANLDEVEKRLRDRRDYGAAMTPQMGKRGQYSVADPNELKNARDIENRYIESGMFDTGKDYTLYSTNKIRNDIRKLEEEERKAQEQAAKDPAEQERRQILKGAFTNLQVRYGTGFDWEEPTEGYDSIGEQMYDMVHGQGSYAAIAGKASKGTKDAEDLLPYALQAARENNSMFRTGNSALDEIPHDGTEQEIEAYRRVISGMLDVPQEQLYGARDRVSGIYDQVRGNVNNMDAVIDAVQRDQYAQWDAADEEIQRMQNAYEQGGGDPEQAYYNYTGEDYAETERAFFGNRTNAGRQKEKLVRELARRENIRRMEEGAGEADPEGLSFTGLMAYMTDDERRKYAAMDENQRKAYLTALDPSLKAKDKIYGDSVSRSFASDPVWGGAASLASIGTNLAAGVIAPVRLAAYALGDESAADPDSAWSGVQHLTDVYRNTRGEVWGRNLNNATKLLSLPETLSAIAVVQAMPQDQRMQYLQGVLDRQNARAQGADSFGNFLYQTTMSIADNLAAMGVAYGAAGGNLNTTLAKGIIQMIMSSEATSSAFQRALEKGVDPTEAALVSVGNGLVEAATEYWSLDRRFGGLTGTSRQAIVSYLISNAAIEGFEEVNADFLNAGLDWIASRVNGHETELESRSGELFAQYKRDPSLQGMSNEELRKKADHDAVMEWWGQVGSSFAAGAMSGFVLSKIYSGTVNRYVDAYTQTGENVAKLDTADVEKILTSSRELVDESKGGQMKTRSEKNLARALNKASEELKTDGKISAQIASDVLFNIDQVTAQRGGQGGKIAAEAWKTSIDNMARSGITSMLEQMGEKVEGVKVTKAAEAIGTMMTNNGRISPAQQRAIDVVPGAQDVANQLMANKITGDERQAEAIKQATGEAIRADARTQQEKAAVSAKTTVNDLLNKQFRQEVANKAISDPQIASEDDFRAAKGERTNSHVEVVAGDVIGDIMRAEKGKLIVRAQDGTETKVNPWDVKAAEGVMGQAAKWMSMERGALSDTLMNDIITMVRDGTMNEKNSGQVLLDSYMVHVAGYAKAAMPKTDLDPKIAQAVYDTAREEAVRDAEELAKRPLKPLRPNEGEVTINLDGETVNREDKKAWKAELKKINDLAQRQRVSFYADLMHRMGLDLEIVDDKSRPDIYGSYLNGKIMLNIAGTEGKAENQRKHHIGVALSHEVTHFMKKYSGESYEQLKNYVIDTLEKQGVSVNNLIAHKMDQYNQDAAVNEDGTPAKLMSVEGALDEVIADACGEMLGQEEFVNGLKQNHTLYEKIRGYVQNFVRRWQAAARGMSRSLSAEAQLMHGNVKELARLWNISLNESLENAYQSKNENQTENENKTDLIGPETDSLPEQKEFAMNSIAERVGVKGNELVAIHNLTARDLLADLKMNGFPGPSIAVTLAKNGWNQYGDISVIFDRYTVDPKMNPRARLYGGDAFTPTQGSFDTQGSAERAMENLRSQPERDYKFGMGINTAPRFMRLQDVEQARRMQAEENYSDEKRPSKLNEAGRNYQQHLYNHFSGSVLPGEIDWFDFKDAGQRTIIQLLDTMNSDEAADLNAMDDEDLAWNYNLMLQENLREMGINAEYWQAEAFNADNVGPLRNYLEKAQLSRTDMSEAKPDEIVGFDHVKMVMLPANVEQDVKDALDDAGIAWRTYTENNVPARTEELNKWLNEYSAEVHAPEEAVMFSRAERNQAYDQAVKDKDTATQQRLVDLAARENGYVKAGYHGTLNGGFTIFDKRFAHVGGNSGAGFYFTDNLDDGTANYSDVEGADNYFKASDLLERILEEANDNGETEYEYDGEIFRTDDSREENLAKAKKILTKKPQVYNVYLDPGRAYIRDFRNSTNMLEHALDDFDESDYNRDDFDSEEEYEEAIREGRDEALYQAINDAVYNAIADVNSNYEIISDVDYESIISDLWQQAVDYDELTWDDVLKVISDQYIEVNPDETADLSADASPEITRAIIENFGYDSIEDREVSKKFNQLKNMGSPGTTTHYIVFRPSQIKSADPVTYDSDGKYIPLEKRFDHTNNDIRYSRADNTGKQLTKDQERYFRNSQIRDENGNLMVMYHGTTAFGEITKFRRGKTGYLGPAIYLTSEERQAKRYADQMGEGNGTIYSVYAKAENPLRIEGQDTAKQILRAIYGSDAVYNRRSAKQANESQLLTNADMKKLQEKGYDGIVWTLPKRSEVEVAVFDSSQIKRTDNENPTGSEDIRYSRADMDADVNTFMMGLEPEDLNSNAERKLLQDYKARAEAVKATEDRIRAMNEELKQATGDEARKLTINLQTEWAKMDRQRQELYDITDSEGYAGMMYRYQKMMREYMSGKTADQVRMSAREAGQAAEEAQKNAARLAEELKEMAAQQDVQAVTSIFRKNDLKARADALIRATQSSLTSEEVQADLARIALKRAMKQNARADLEALAGKLNLNQVGIRNTEAINALEEMRGMEIGLDDQQWGDLKSAGWDAAKIRRTLAGTGITMRHGGRYLDIQGAQLGEIAKAAPGRIDTESTDWPSQLLKLAEDAKQTHQEYDEAQLTSQDAIMSTIEVISDTLAGITPTIPKDPAVAEQIRQLMTYNQRLSRSAREAAGGMESVNRMLEDIRRKNAAAAGAESIMNRDVTRAIEYYSKMSDLAHERSNAAEMEQLRRTLESQGAQRVMEEQARWRNVLETNERVRNMAEKNEKARRQVNTVVGRINDRIINETDIKNVPESVKGIARAMAGMFIRNDTGYGARKFGNTDAKTLKDWRKIYDALDQRDGTDLSFDWVSEEDREDVQEAVEKALQDIRDGLGFWNASKGRSETNIQGSKNALDRIQRGVNQIYEIIRSQTEIEINGRKQDVAELAYEAETEAEKREPFREYEGKLGRTAGATSRFAFWGNMTPQYYFKRLANNALSLLFGDAKQGEHRTGLLQHEFKERFNELAEKHGFSSYDTDEKRTFTLKNKDTVTLTTGQMMSLYALWNREQTLGPEWSHHILGGGIVPGEIREDKLLVRKRAEERPHRVDAADVMTIINALTNEQRALVDDVVHVLSTDGSRLGNEASMKMYGIKKYNETYYFPFHTWSGVLNKNSNAGGALTSPTAQNALKQSSFSKRRIRYAATPLVLDDFMHTAVSHMNQMITYSTMVNAVENFNKVLNHRLATSAVEGQTRLDNPVTRNVEALLRERYGKNAVDYLRTWMQDINGGVKPDTRRSLQEYLLGLFRKNAVAGSLSVALQQPLSYIRAANAIDTKYLLAAMNPATFKGSYKEMMAHSGVAVIKDMGRFDVNYGQTGTEYMMPDGYRKVGTKVREGVEEYSTKLPELMDQVTWTRMWTACKLEQQALNPDADVRSDEFLDKVAERFNELMRDTQVYDSLMVRSANMRSKAFPMKTLTSFMAEPTLTANLMMDSFRTVNTKGGKKRLAEALATYLISAVAQAAIKAGMGAGRTPDEKKTFLENFAYKFAYNAIDELNPFTLIPGYDEIVTALSGSDISDDAYSVIKKLRDAAVQLPGMFDKSGEELYQGIEDSAGQIAQLFTGVPVKNIMRDLRAMYNYYTGDKYANRETSGAVIKYQTIDTVAKQNLIGMINKYLKDAGVGGFDTTNEAYYGRIYQAMREGRTQDAEEMAEYLELGKGVKPETVESKIGTAARKDADASAAETADFLLSSGMMGDADYINDSYVSGEMSAAEYGEAWRRMYPQKTEDDLYWQIDKLDYRREHGGDEGYSKYLGLREAIGNNRVDEIRAAVNTMTAHGTTMENIRTQITKDYKDAYLNAAGSEKVRLRDALVKAYRAAGLTDDEANKKINAWKK